MSQGARYCWVRHEVLGDCWALVTPYNTEFVEQLKGRVAARDRWWDVDNRRWLVRGVSEKAVEDLVGEFYDELVYDDSLGEDYDEPRSQPAREPGTHALAPSPTPAATAPPKNAYIEACTALGVLPSAYPEVKRAAYEALLNTHADETPRWARAWAVIEKTYMDAGLPFDNGDVPF